MDKAESDELMRRADRAIEAGLWAWASRLAPRGRPLTAEDIPVLEPVWRALPPDVRAAAVEVRVGLTGRSLVITTDGEAVRYTDFRRDRRPRGSL